LSKFDIVNRKRSIMSGSEVNIGGEDGEKLEAKIEGLRVGGDGAASEEEEDDGSGDVVNPWDVSSKSETGIDYAKLISK
jgi:hypothetical protein